MLFPEEIFKMILKKHKIICLEEKLNFNRIKIQYGCYRLSIKKLQIDILPETEFHPTSITYSWQKSKLYMNFLISF